MNITHATVGDGKYAITYIDGKAVCQRNGEPWDRDVSGDKLIYCLVAEVETLREQVSTLTERLEGFEATSPIAELEKKHSSTKGMLGVFRFDHIVLNSKQALFSFKRVPVFTMTFDGEWTRGQDLVLNGLQGTVKGSIGA